MRIQLALLSCFILFSIAEVDTVFTLKEPYFIGSGMWDTNGKTVTLDSAIRLTKDIQNGSSRLWNKRPFTHSSFTILTKFRITGKNPGGDGLAMWITDKIINTEGRAFGGPVQWKGLMIAVDTFDNNRNGDNPIIYGVINAGNTVFNPDTDGMGMIAGSCKAPVRNQNNPVVLKVSAISNQIIVSVLINDKEQPCFTLNTVLPEKKYLTYSASSFYSANDIHDIIQVTMNYTPSGKGAADPNAKKATPKATPNANAKADTKANAKVNAKANTNTNAKATSNATPKPIPEKFKFTDPNAAAVHTAVEEMKKNVVKSFESIIKSNEDFSKVIVELASHPPRDYKKEVNELSNVLVQLRTIINTIPAAKNSEELQKIKSNLDEVKEHLGTVTEVMTILNSRLNAQKSDTIYAIQKRSASGHWMFFIIFELVFAAGIVFWKQMKVEKAKVI